jgi:D-glutamate N-acetyltransferase
MTEPKTTHQTNQPDQRRLVILTDSHTNPLTAKTAFSMLRYCPEEVVALLDTTQSGKTAGDLLGVGGEIPVVGRLDQAPDATGLMIGIAPAGGRIPASWRPLLLEAISRRMPIYSGLHEFLSDDPEFSAAALKYGTALIDIRKNDEHQVAQVKPLREGCLRIHTVGNDCSVGKMIVAVELTKALERQHLKARFLATGQTGILIQGDGCPVDCVVGDFISGAIEKQVVANEQYDYLLVEGQGCLTHPRYAAVTLGLLHGCRPQAMILCYEMGRTMVHGMPEIPLKPLSQVREIYETMASLMVPSRVIGIAMNSRRATAEEAEEERERVHAELGLPVCDVFRHGPDDLVHALRLFREEILPADGRQQPPAEPVT